MDKEMEWEHGGVRYRLDCEANGSFKHGGLWCIECGSKVEVVAMEDQFFLTCSGCNKRIKTFHSEEEMYRYIDQQWAVLENRCQEAAKMRERS